MNLVAPSSTYDLALKLLAFRARSVAELRRQLLRKGRETDEVEDAIHRLRDQRLLDDAAFALAFVRSRLLGPGSSRVRIIQELARKGVSRDDAERAIAELQQTEGVDPLTSIHRIAEKKWRALASLDEFTRRRRLYGFLARRGFNPDEIRSALAQLGEEISL